jgi:hypothetical protein
MMGRSGSSDVLHLDWPAVRTGISPISSKPPASRSRCWTRRPRQALYRTTKGILRKVNKLVMTALRLAASRKISVVNEANLLDATTGAFL